MSNAYVLEMKRGATFSAGILYADSGVDVDLTGYTITSQVRQFGTLIQTMTVVISNQTTNTGEFTVSATATQTADWPVGTLAWDIRLADGATIVYSKTFQILVDERVTIP